MTAFDKRRFSFGERGQTTIFIIVALAIAAGVLVFFAFRGRIGDGGISPELAPVYDYYQNCIENQLESAVRIAGAQGGRIDVGEYIPGSDYAPFSSQLNFLGTPIPYWYYVSGNGLIKEDVPSKSEMEKEIAQFIEEGLAFCDFEKFYAEGFNIEKSQPVVNVDVSQNKVTATVDSNLIISKGSEKASKSTHTAEIDSKLGKFYNLATEIYLKQKEEAFLEKYALDVLYLYAPVDGVEIQCAPKIWSTQKVVGDLKDALEQNFAEIKFKGGYYQLSDDDKKYFVLDKNVDESVNILYSKNWPTKIEITGEGVDEDLMIAETVGTQEGLGTMGFCYAPYHFVYDVSFPAMIQIFDNDEFFQFPVSVIIDNNVARKANLTEGFGRQNDFDLCRYKEAEIEVNLFDINLNRVDGNLSYECFDQRCRLGTTVNGRFRGSAPKCVNGILKIKSEGFSDKSQTLSTNSQSSADVIMDREFEVHVDADLFGREGTKSIISFTRDDGKTVSASLPEFNTIKLSEGLYNITMYVYGNSTITIPASTKYQCVDVAKGGLLGFFGGKEEKCFDISVPESKIDYALIGGGKTQDYILESDLKKGKLNVQATMFKTPTSLDDLQNNFELFDTRRVNLIFNDN